MQKSAAFLLRDSHYSLDSIVYASYENNVIHVEVYPDVSDDILSYLIPYVVARYSLHFGVGSEAFAVTNTNGSERMQNPYNMIEQYAKEHPGVVKNVAMILCGIGRRINQYPTHSKLVDVVPDFEHMDMNQFNKWERYFEGTPDDAEE